MLYQLSRAVCLQSCRCPRTDFSTPKHLSMIARIFCGQCCIPSMHECMHPTLCGHLLWRFAIQQQSTAPQSDHALLTQVGSMYSWTLPCVSSLVPSVLHLSHGFQCSPTLNRQPYEGRLPLTSWWRKSSNMTVGQCSPIYLAHHCYDWHPGSRCG